MRWQHPVYVFCACAWVFSGSVARGQQEPQDPELPGSAGPSGMDEGGVTVGPEEPAQPQVLELSYIPTARAQIAIWIEDAAGAFLATVGLTDAVANRGIGNRPGASQMNSGFRWPYGRREGVLPIWAHRRASAPGAQQFSRLIFQDRPEGWASRKVQDSSPDTYFCLAWDRMRSAREALDAVSCASVFASDKGRFMTEADVAAGYGEPYEDVETGEGRLEPMAPTSLYPPRRDIVKSCGATCDEHADVARLAEHARSVMPDIDAVSMATPPGDQMARRLFMVPNSWPAGQYRACLEINVEGDYNETWNGERYPTPETPMEQWDAWATRQGYGYPYRGQPSIVYCVPFELGMDSVQEYATEAAEGGVGSWDTAAADYGDLLGMDGMTDDPVAAPGSGADRLRQDAAGNRLSVVVKPPGTCEGNGPPSAVEQLQVERYPNERHAHEWVGLRFAAAGDDTSIFRYDIRVSTEPIVDEASFMRAETAKNATIEAEELRVPVDERPGSMVEIGMGGLVQGTHYFIGVRAVDGCAASSEIRVVETTTPMRVFATVTPCFVATAAYGTPLAEQIGSLRRFRDRQLANSPLGRGLIALYTEYGPRLAAVIREDDSLRALARAVLAPIVAVARWFDSDSRRAQPGG